MIELDKQLPIVCKIINECYETCFPNLPKYPKFSFTRAMINIWKTNVFDKLRPKFEQKVESLLQEIRDAKILELSGKSGSKLLPESSAKNIEIEPMLLEEAKNPTEYQKESLLAKYFFVI